MGLECLVRRRGIFDGLAPMSASGATTIDRRFVEVGPRMEEMKRRWERGQGYLVKIHRPARLGATKSVCLRDGSVKHEFTA